MCSWEDKQHKLSRWLSLKRSTPPDDLTKSQETNCLAQRQREIIVINPQHAAFPVFAVLRTVDEEDQDAFLD